MYHQWTWRLLACHALVFDDDSMFVTSSLLFLLPDLELDLYHERYIDLIYRLYLHLVRMMREVRMMMNLVEISVDLRLADRIEHNVLL